MRRRSGPEHGTVTIWLLGLSVCVLFLGGLSLDLWRAITVRRELTAMADSAATAGTNGLDENALRRGEVVVDAGRAKALALDALTRHSGAGDLDAAQIDVQAPARVRVAVAATVHFTLLGILVDERPLRVEATATAEARRVP